MAETEIIALLEGFRREAAASGAPTYAAEIIRCIREAENQQLRQRMESLAHEIEGERVDCPADVDLDYNDGLEVAAELVRLAAAPKVTADA